MVVSADLSLCPSLTWTCRTSTSTPPAPFGILRVVSHQLIRSNHLVGSAPTAHSLPRLSTAVGIPSLSVCTMTCSMPASYGKAPTITPGRRNNKKPRRLRHQAGQRGFLGGSYRDRTDDIHGVNVALYQLS